MKSLRLNRPHALIMVGIPGSGKSTFAAKFSEMFNAPHIEADVIDAHAKDSDAAKHLMNYIVSEYMKTGQSLIIDAYADSRVVRTELAKYCRHLDYTPLFVWIQTDEDTARKRMIRSKKMTQSEFDTSIKHFSAPHESEHALVLSGKHTYATQAKSVLKRLSVERPTQQKPASTTTPVRSGSIRVQ